MTIEATTVDRPGQEPLTLQSRSLVRAVSETVHSTIKFGKLWAGRRLFREEIVIICEVHQIWKITNPIANLSGHHVMRQIQLLQAVHFSNTTRNTSTEIVVRQDNDRHT